MKKAAKLLGIIALSAVIVFGIAGCKDTAENSGKNADPGLTGTVSISGTAQVGQRLTANTGSLDGNGTITYQWKRTSANIGTDSDSYTVEADDVGYTITVTVTRAGYSGSVTSPATAIVASAGNGAATAGLLFTLLHNGNAYSVSKGTARAASVVIPSSHEGLPVTEIEVSGFRDYANMTSITIPSSVTSIGPQAFFGCTRLESITIPFVYTHFGYLFGASSSSSQNTSIPASLKTVVITGGSSIGSQAFYGCRSLESITIPDSVTSIGGGAFYDCTGLESITIPDSVTSIGQQAFYDCTSLASVTIPDSVTSIGTNAFSGCADLTSITIPDSVTSIPGGAFSGCTGLASITIPDSVTSIDIFAFWGCTSLASITIPDSVTSIDREAFYNCAGLTSITIPDSVTSIGREAFSGCSGLASITIPDSVTSIGVYAFSGCTRLESITIPFVGGTLNGSTNASFGYIFGSRTTDIPASLKTVVITGGDSIGDSAFSGCTGLTSITIPSSVTSIGPQAFYNCTGLESITIPFVGDTLNGTADIHFGYIFSPRINNINNQNTYVPASLKTVVITGGDSIGDSAFSGCSGLTSITIPDSVTSIGNFAFRNCSGLESVTIGSSVTSIGIGAFEGCTGLASITIPDSMTSIDEGAFWGFSGLASITIPDSVTSIGDFAFSGCSNLETVTCLATTPPLLTPQPSSGLYTTFSNTASTLQIKVPADSVSEYQAATGWSDYSDMISAIEE